MARRQNLLAFIALGWIALQVCNEVLLLGHPTSQLTKLRIPALVFAGFLVFLVWQSGRVIGAKNVD